LRVNQWSVSGIPSNFETVQSTLNPDGTPVTVDSGAHGQQCGWLAVRDANRRGLFAGWEFDGRAQVTVRQQGSQGTLQFYSTMAGLNHPLANMESFDTPHGFLGLFHGDFDEAGYRTQYFVESVLAKPMPDAGAFPYVAWDSWAYGGLIDEETLMRNAQLAAGLGAELFIVDLGWARSIGDWYEDPVKFPDGLAAVSAYVHSLGMKFGLHFALSDADPNSPVLQANPDWTSSVSDGYFGAVSLCLSNADTRSWVIQQALHIIDDYQVDWILQDGENMVKECTKTTHTHDPGDSNYANAVQGIDAVVSAIQAARPNVYWENCEDGGNMMTFNMVKNYVTSITNDASGSLGGRQAVYGVTYPFPPRYADRYMPASDGVTPSSTHSYRFGGNWVLMLPLDRISGDQAAVLAREIAHYKSTRSRINGSKVFHIRPPSLVATDAIMSYNPALDSAVAVITRAPSDAPRYILMPLGLNPAQRYTVSFEVSSTTFSLPGAQLMTDGIMVPLPNFDSSEIVHIDAQ
jgi:alpha-galactosidase